MPENCTRAELIEAVARLRPWTHNKYGDMNPKHVEAYGFPTRLSSEAMRSIQKWIDTPTALCRFYGTDHDFANATLTVCEKIQSSGRVDPNKVVCYFPHREDFATAVKLKDGTTRGPEVFVLAMVYSLIIQMVEMLPERCCAGRPATKGHDHVSTYDYKLLGHIKLIDGTEATAQSALDAVAHLLGVLGNGLTVMVSALDSLYNPDSDYGRSRKILDRVSSTLEVVARTNRIRVWLSYTEKGECEYRDRAAEDGSGPDNVRFSMRQYFKVKSVAGKLITNMGHPLTELRFAKKEL
ncbi:hypothetical protein BJ166DRAFT_507817 [Pestalotiopsis sp. NC0098]|nr:hypothetical protein BJ166DRAFT_507817 [Pestalotiopsis sp. NC0098]